MREKNAIVTGATTHESIGFTIARELVRKQVNVMITGRSEKGLQESYDNLIEFKRKIDSKSKIFWCAADLSACDNVSGFVDTAKQKFKGTVDILINNHAMFFVGNFLDTDINSIKDIVTANNQSPYIVTKNVIHDMVDKGFGRIVNVSSSVSLGLIPGISLYSSTKAAINTFTGILNLELGGTGVTASVVYPAAVTGPTGQVSRMDVDLQEQLHTVLSGTTPDDIAHGVIYCLQYGLGSYHTNRLNDLLLWVIYGSGIHRILLHFGVHKFAPPLYGFERIAKLKTMTRQHDWKTRRNYVDKWKSLFAKGDTNR